RRQIITLALAARSVPSRSPPKALSSAKAAPPLKARGNPAECLVSKESVDRPLIRGEDRGFFAVSLEWTWSLRAFLTRNPPASRGRASMAVRSQAEPGNEDPRRPAQDVIAAFGKGSSFSRRCSA